MIIYFDSSALVKSVVDEEGSPQVKRFLSECLVSEEIDFVTSAITKAEVMAALSAMRRGKHLTEKKFRKAIAGFEVRWEIFSVPEVTVSLIDKAGEIGLNHKIKGCDAFQLACAVESESTLFISTDNDLNTAAVQKGLSVWNPMTDPIPTMSEASLPTEKKT